MLDLGCGSNKQPGFIGMDKRAVSGVDIIHDAEVFPYPLEDESCAVVMASHLLEHIKPWYTIDLFNEIWRILEPGGLFLAVVPYATSFGMMQDPTHCNFFNEATFYYFCPDHPSCLYYIYEPKPWKEEKLFWNPQGNIEVALRKMGGKNEG